MVAVEHYWITDGAGLALLVKPLPLLALPRPLKNRRFVVAACESKAGYPGLDGLELDSR